MDKPLILKKIKDYLNYKNDKDFAAFLGIKQNTLSSWKSRNMIDYDLIISKCEFIDANWLLTGEGEMLKSVSAVNVLTLNNSAKNEFKDKYFGLLEENRELFKENRELRKEIEELKGQGGKDIVVGA